MTHPAASPARHPLARGLCALLIAVLLTTLVGCAADGSNNRAAAGATIGAVLGAIAGNQSDDKHRSRNRLLGAIIGAAIGGAIGNYLDRKEQELRAALRNKAQIERRSPNELLVSFSDSVPFDTGSARLKGAAYPTLEKLAQILRDNTNARLVVTGHTDNVGNHLANQRLSERRAATVARFLVQRGQIPAHLVAVRGAGEMAPIADNDTALGRARNRRVEVLILPMSQPVPPVRFTMTEDTEPRGRRVASRPTMRLPRERPSPDIPLGDRNGRPLQVSDTPSQRELPVHQVIRQKPHLYSPIRTVDELISA